MKSELSFLMDLFLNDDVPMPIKKLIVARIRDVEKHLTILPTVQRGTNANSPAYFKPIANPESVIANQSPSMQRIMAQNPDLIPAAPMVAPPATPAAAAALQSRAALLAQVGKEKPEAGRTGPRKA